MERGDNMNYIDGKFMQKDDCENMKKVISRYGYAIVCDEKEEAEAKAKELRDADLILPAGEDCEKLVTVASRVGVTVVCDEKD